MAPQTPYSHHLGGRDPLPRPAQQLVHAARQARVTGTDDVIAEKLPHPLFAGEPIPLVGGAKARNLQLQRRRAGTKTQLDMRRPVGTLLAQELLQTGLADTEKLQAGDHHPIGGRKLRAKPRHDFPVEHHAQFAGHAGSTENLAIAVTHAKTHRAADGVGDHRGSRGQHRLLAIRRIHRIATLRAPCLEVRQRDGAFLERHTAHGSQCLRGQVIPGRAQPAVHDEHIAGAGQALELRTQQVPIVADGVLGADLQAQRFEFPRNQRRIAVHRDSANQLVAGQQKPQFQIHSSIAGPARLSRTPFSAENTPARYPHALPGSQNSAWKTDESANS